MGQVSVGEHADIHDILKRQFISFKVNRVLKITQMSGQNKVERLKQWLQPPQSFKSHLSWLYYTDMVNFLINKRQ
jgi:hypothetical protein